MMERFLLPFLCAQGALETRLLVNSSSCDSAWARWVLEFPTRLQAPSLIQPVKFTMQSVRCCLGFREDKAPAVLFTRVS